MAFTKQVDLLEPIDMAEHLDKIELYLGQVCQIAGISKMQLDYWTNKAQIPTKGKKQRIYDMDALETVMLIKQAKDKGLNLGSTIRKYATAFTRTGTLSLVMTSCGGMFSVIVRRSTLTIRSTTGMSRKSPGPFGLGSSRPSRKTIPRSYSRATLIAEKRNSTTRKTTIAKTISTALMTR